MEPYTHYLMWMKSRHDIVMSSLINKKNKNSSSSSSWEEEAFADDKSGGVLGGFVWPPRSYFCSFCKREFRSAQALGGHMNVHRRDRAKLKQSLIISPPTTTQDLNHTTHSINNSYSFHFSQPKLPSPCGSKNEEAMLPNQELDCLVDTKLSFGIDLDEDMIRCKRRKKTGFSLLKKPCYGLQGERLGLGNKVNNPTIMEDIDLELRLGDPPAVK